MAAGEVLREAVDGDCQQNADRGCHEWPKPAAGDFIAHVEIGRQAEQDHRYCS